MQAIKLKDDIYWVGVVDWNLRNFHGYTTNRGATYNSYLIMDEKITLIDGVKAPFVEEQLARIKSIIDPAKIDYIVSNHVEMDHSGSLPLLKKACPNAVILTSAPNGQKGLTAHYGDLGYQAVKTNESISIGKRTLQFVGTPMLHWPDNMVTYCPEEKILFSNDAFGQHYASSERVADEANLPVILAEAKKYYANIIMCYGKQAQGAVEIVSGLELDAIYPSHGVIWNKEFIPTILDAYRLWSANEPEGGAIVVYDSMWHSTEKMAKAIVEGFTQKGISVKLFDLKENHNSDIMPDLLTSKYVAVGSPTLNNNLLPTVAAFLCYMRGLSPKNRQAFAFGSYGWGGQSIKQVEAELEACGFDICLEAQRIQYIPSEEQLLALTEKVKEL